MTNMFHISYKLTIFEGQNWCKKKPKNHAKSLYDVLALLKKIVAVYTSSGHGGLLASLRWWLTFSFDCDNELSEGQPLILIRLVYRGRGRAIPLSSKSVVTVDFSS